MKKRILVLDDEPSEFKVWLMTLYNEVVVRLGVWICFWEVGFKKRT